MTRVPVIDLFAGPGGLSEGFSRCRDKRIAFDVVLSVEKDGIAAKTLGLRKLVGRLDGAGLRQYKKFLTGALSLEDLRGMFPDAVREADNIAWHKELGKENEEEVFSRISKELGSTKNWVLIGGPPCQAYSMIGRARIGKEAVKSDSRNNLYTNYLDIIARFSPPIFVMENVRGFLSSRDHSGRILDRVLSDLRSPNDRTGIESVTRQAHRYEIFSLVTGRPLTSASLIRDFTVKAEEYGIPQARHRVILVGVRADQAPAGLPPLKKSQHVQTVGDAIGDLPPLRSKISRGGDSPEKWSSAVRDLDINVSHPELIGELQRAQDSLFWQADSGGSFLRSRTSMKLFPDWYAKGDVGGVIQHECKAHMASDLRRYVFASVFGKVHDRSPLLRDYPEVLLPDHKNVALARTGSRYFADRFRVQLSTKPSTTITAHIAKDGHYYIHPDPRQVRSLSVREAARLQTFPDDYFFVGNRTQQYRQVGNAVPPLLARRIAEYLAEHLLR